MPSTSTPQRPSRLHQLSRMAGAVATGAVLLTACGGGSDPVVPSIPLVTGTDIPVSATTSSAGAFTFVNTLAGVPDNTAEPITVGDAILATSDTDEPSAL
jgi:hypothetical protein